VGDAAPPLFFAIADFPVNYGAYQAVRCRSTVAVHACVCYHAHSSHVLQYGFRMAPVLVVRPVEKFRNSIPKPQDWKDTRTQFGVVRPTNSADELASFITNVTGIPVQVYHDPEPRFVLSGALAHRLRIVTPPWFETQQVRCGGCCGSVVGRYRCMASCTPVLAVLLLQAPLLACWLPGCLFRVCVRHGTVHHASAVLVRRLLAAVWLRVLVVPHNVVGRYYASPDVKHKFHLFSGESRSQFVVEGLIIGSLSAYC